MRTRFGQLAQLVEQRIENPRVRGSIPRLATKDSSIQPRLRTGLFALWLPRSLRVAIGLGSSAEFGGGVMTVEMCI